MNRKDLSLGVLMLGVGTVIASCAGPQQHEVDLKTDQVVVDQYLADKPDGAKKYYAMVPRQGKRNEVLNHMRAGLAAFELGDIETAHQSFDTAATVIETFYADDEKAKAARSLWTKENAKDFKGEPWERSMLYYYLGLTELARGEFDAAAVAFRNGEYQDSLSEAENFQADFAMLTWLTGWAGQCKGNDGNASSQYRDAARMNPSFSAPRAGANVLLIGETGGAPEKYADGQNKEAMRVRQSSNVGPAGVRFVANGDAVEGSSAESIYFQASTRGGRAVDKILEGKAEFKDTTGAAGQVAIATGASMAMASAYSGNDNMAYGGLAAMGVGLLLTAAAEAAKPDADLRYWDNLPDKVWLASVKVPESTESVDVQFVDASGAPVVGSDRAISVTWAGKCGVAWARSTSALSVPERAPNSGVAAK